MNELCKFTFTERIRRLLLFAICGILLGAAFNLPFTQAAAVLAWLFCFLLCALYRQPVRPSHYEVFITGIFVYLTALSWLPRIIATYAHIGISAAAAPAVLLFAVAALQFVFVNIVYRGLERTFLSSLRLSLPAAWFAAEILTPKFFPWSLGHTQAALAALVQLSDIAGAPLISLLIIWWTDLFISLAFLSMSPKVKKRDIVRLSSALIMSISLVAIYAAHVRATLEPQIESAPRLNIAIVQPNFSPLRDYRVENMHEVVNKLRRMSLSVVESGKVDLLIWPESSVWFDYRFGQTAVTEGSAIDPFPGLPVALLFGGQLADPDIGKLPPAYYNSALLMSPAHEIIGSYRKTVLFPFSERIPFSELLPILSKFSSDNYQIAAGPEEQAPLSVPLQRGFRRESVKLALAICYEDTWDNPLLDAVEIGGADMLVGLSNDAWFLDSPAAAQHHLLASFRAIELRRFLIRSTVNGVTAIVDPFGKTIERLPAADEAVLLSATARPLHGLTVFSQGGRLAAMLVAAGLTIIALLRYCNCRSSKGTTTPL